MNSAFVRFADAREQMNQVMLTHLYLLIGCAFPACITFIILDGGFLNGEHAVFAYSGVIFLGIGDTVAAIYGREVGSSAWRSHIHKKSQEGSSALVITVTILYYCFCYSVFPYMCSVYLIIILSTIAASALEGWTSQFDNLVCPIFYFVALH